MNMKNVQTVLNLDKYFTPYKSEINFELFRFPGGEKHIKIKKIPSAVNSVLITQNFNR